VDVLSIGQLADAAGVPVETVRYYERRGLIAEPPRSAAGYRQYSANDVERLAFIGRAKALGFTLTEIRELAGDDRGTERIIEAAKQKLDAVADRQRELAETRVRLERLLDLCASGDADGCAALNLAG
jgi:DNA-binding transcriptional MerR regulator